MKLKQVGAVLTFIFGLMGAYSAWQEITKPSSHLTAFISDSIFYTPPQFNHLMEQVIKKADYDDIQNMIDGVAREATFPEKQKLRDNIVNRIMTPFSPPFDHSLAEYRRLIYVDVANNGAALAKNIYIDFPEKVLVMIEDDKQESVEKAEPLTRLEIGSIKQNGKYRVWAWAKSNDFSKYKINVGSDDEVAEMKFEEGYTGFEAFFAENAREILLIILMLIPFFLYFAYNAIYSVFRHDTHEQ